jgi:hypothetical protein
VRRSLSLVSLLTLAAVPLVGQQALVGIYPAGVPLDSGQRASVPLVVDLRALGGSALGSYQLRVTWDPAVVRYVSAGAGAFGAPTVNEANVAAGSLTLAGANPGGASGLFSVVELTFEMRVGTGSSPVSVVSPELTAAGTFVSIPVIATPGDICTSAGIYGDVNRDGSILSNDALLVVTAAVGLSIAPYSLVNADVDNDGDADTRDALVILTAAVGLPTTGFRVGQPNASSCAGAPAATIALTPPTATLAAGDVLPIAAQVFDAAGNPTSATGLAWSSNAPGVATVDSTGRVTAVANGPATITAMALGVPNQTVSVTVQDRHTWYVDAVAAAGQATHLGSAAYPFPAIQSALDAAGPRDTVLVAVAPAPYGAASITKAVTVVGDSGAAGMPRLRNSAGVAIVSNAPGTVTLKRLVLEESNAGLDARGDTLVVQSVAATTLRGPAFSIRGMRYASLTGVSATSAVLAGVLADSTGTVRINGAGVQVIAVRNDSAVGVAILNGDTAIVTGLNVFGIESGQGAVFSNLTRGVLDGFDVRASGGVNADSVFSMRLANGRIRDAGSSSDRPISIHADTATVDSVVVDGADRGIQLSPMSRDTLTQPNTVATITRSAISNVAGTGGVIVDRFSRLLISRLAVANVQLDHGIDVRRVTDVRIDSSVVTGVMEGFALTVDPAATLSMRDGKLRGHAGGLKVDEVQTVSLVGVEVDSSAVPPPFCYSCSAGFGVHIVHADSVRLDSLNVHDNTGGGILVDSARTVVGRGSVVARNQGFGGSGGAECQPPACGLKKEGFSPPRPALTHAQFSQNNVPGVVLNLVQQTALVKWTVDDNTRGALAFFGWDLLVAPAATLDSSSFRGPGTLLSAFGTAALDAQLTVRGGAFRLGQYGIAVTNLDRLSVTGATFDSVGGYYSPALNAYSMRDVVLQDDTVTAGAGWAFQLQTVGSATASGNLFRGRRQADVNSQEAALDFNGVDTGFVSGNRFEANLVRGIIVRNGAGPMTIDGNVVADDSGFAALQLHQPATVTHNLFARNANGVYVADAGGTSVIGNNNFEGNVFTAVRNETGTIVNAQSNWWNDANGPQCSGVATGCNPSAGDIVYGLFVGVDFSGFLTSRAGGAPIAAPPIRTARREVNR